MAKASWQVLRADRELLWLPVLSGVLSLVAAAVFFVPGVLMSGDLGASDGSDVAPMTYALFVMGSLAAAGVAVIFQGALVHGANERLSGGDPTVSSAVSGSISKAHHLLPWAAINWTVGAVLRAVRERAGFLGAIATSIVGLAWELVTFLTVPVIVLEDRGPIDGVKRSAELFRRTWGENVAAQVGFGLLGIVAILPAIVVVFVAGSLGTVGLVVGLAVALTYAAVVMVVLSALNAVFQAVLYRYAASGEVPTAFGGTGLDRSFEPR